MKKAKTPFTLENTNREKFLRYLKKNNINAVISYTPLHRSKMGKKFFDGKKKTFKYR